MENTRECNSNTLSWRNPDGSEKSSDGRPIVPGVPEESIQWAVRTGKELNLPTQWILSGFQEDFFFLL